MKVATSVGGFAATKLGIHFLMLQMTGVDARGNKQKYEIPEIQH